MSRCLPLLNCESLYVEVGLNAVEEIQSIDLVSKQERVRTCQQLLTKHAVLDDHSGKAKLMFFNNYKNIMSARFLTTIITEIS